jgi:membrane-associated phospholipid phosphatase
LTEQTRWDRLIGALTRRLMTEEVLFTVFIAALLILVTATGKLGVVVYRLIQDLRFVGIVVGVAAVIFTRAYLRAKKSGEAGSARTLWLEPARSRAALRAAVRTVREFGPLFACIAIYEALHDLTPVLRPEVEDRLLVASDHFFLHADVGRWLNDHMGSVAMTKILTFCYVSYAFASPIYAGLQYFRGRYRAFHDFAMAITITAFIGYAGYLLLPAVGPYVYQHALYSDPLPGWGHGGVLDIISKMKGSARDAFPSLHTAMTTVVLGSMFRDARKLFWTYLPIGLGLYLATMYLRVHYATDVAAGFALGFFALWAAPKINRWWYERRIPREAAIELPRQRAEAMAETT